MELSEDRRKEALQVDLFDERLDINVLVIPEAEGRVIEMRAPDVINDGFGLFLGTVFVYGFKAVELTRGIYSNNFEW